MIINDDDFFSGGFGRHFQHHMGQDFAHMGRGNIAPNVLKALEEKPMHGYEIIQHFEKISFGFWRPSPGSIYPILQSLQDQGLVRSHEEDGKRIYEITDAGREKLKDSVPWNRQFSRFEQRRRRGEFMKRIFSKGLKESMGSIRTISKDGTDEDIEKMGDILNQAADALAALVHEIESR